MHFAGLTSVAELVVDRARYEDIGEAESLVDVESIVSSARTPQRHIARAICVHALALMLVAIAVTANAGEIWNVCFTPGEDCTALIVGELANAKQKIDVQAYSFTSAPIAKALVEAKARGVEVRVILDKSQKTDRYSSAIFLTNAGIPVWIDDKVAIAHSKVMIIDDNTVITGSFNFTGSAQRRNAENVLIIRDRELAAKYARNWESRKHLSHSYRVSDRYDQSKPTDIIAYAA